jgi:hypothetical protein
LTGAPREAHDRGAGRLDVLLLAAAGLVVHGPLLLNDGIYYDGWILYFTLRKGEWGLLWDYFATGSLPLLAFFHAAFFPLGDAVFAYHVLAFASLVGTAVLVDLLGRGYGLARGESLFLAFFTLCYPAMTASTTLMFNCVPYLTCLALFLLGCHLALGRPGAPPGALRQGAALILFTLGFTTNSLLALYGVFLVLLLQARRRSGLAPAVRSALPFLVLPVAYWWFHQRFFPRSGFYSDYNVFVLDAASFWTQVRWFAYTGVYRPFKDVVASLLREPWLALGPAAMVAWHYRRAGRRGAGFFSDVRTMPLLLLGGGALGLAVLPYALVGKAPYVDTWSTRHALLLGLPLALLALGALRKTSREGTRLRWGGGLVALLVLAGFARSWNSSYLYWHARWVADRSAVANLRLLDGARGTSIFWVEDRRPSRGPEWSEFYEWSGLFTWTWGDERRIGFDRERAAGDLVLKARYFNRDYHLSALDVRGCQAILRLEGTDALRRSGRLTARYLWHRWFRPGELDGFLQGLTRVTVAPLAAPEATHCRSGGESQS